MFPTESLAQILRSMSSEVRLIKQFAEEVNQALITRNPPVLPSGFTLEDVKELRKVHEASGNALSAQVRKRGSVTLTVDLSSQRVADFVLKAAGAIKHRGYLPEMTLSYLASHLEAFVKDYVLEVLLHDIRMLRSSATIPLDELAKHRSLKSVWQSVAEREVETLGYGSIDDIAAYFTKRFNIDLSKIPKWHKVRESLYRRNLIVHNRGHVNAIYRRT